MRDIRADLRERLENIGVQRSHFQERISQLIKVEEMLTTLLEEEEARWKSQQQFPLSGLEAEARPKTNGHTALVRFIMEMLGDGKEWEKQALADQAKSRGLIGPGKAPVRVVHWALVGMSQNGIVEKVGSKWRLSKVSENGEE